MPNPLRRALCALALAAIAFGCATTAASAEPPGAKQRARTVPTYRTPPAPKPTLGERAARNALRAVGVPYQWGGTSLSRGFDCSGLVFWAYGRLGKKVPRSSYGLYRAGRGVARSRMKAGDVLVFSGLGHVGIYAGHGRMVHAPHSGALVSTYRLRHSYWGGRIVGVRRIARG
jgi:cell wall-associated NlpC family hydrolase